jgi:hypothetical protein
MKGWAPLGAEQKDTHGVEQHGVSSELPTQNSEKPILGWQLSTFSASLFLVNFLANGQSDCCHSE